MSLTYELIRSWHDTEGSITTNEEILSWVRQRNESLDVSVKKIEFPKGFWAPDKKGERSFWFYDEKVGCIQNKNNSFFQLAGYQQFDSEDQLIVEQPIILQQEIGYLGIICQMKNGVLNFLMQAKIEPGNINAIQISPTIQATKSNFMQMHGGNAPSYLQYFVNSHDHVIIVDQLQSEQSSRFLKKRNRNMIILVEDDVEELPSHKWMTLGQIKALMQYDNLVNMDSRTVLSCIPFTPYEPECGEMEEMRTLFSDDAMFRSIFCAPDTDVFHRIYNDINDRKMYSEKSSQLVALKSLSSWDFTDREIVCRAPYDFKICYCQIEIEGREIRTWEQPLVEALGMYVLGIFTCVDNGVRKFLVRVLEEVGCFDTAEIGPVVQIEPTNEQNKLDPVEVRFLQMMKAGEGTVVNVVLSEEGGRFYCEQNHNVIIEIEKEELGELPKECYWIDYATLNSMIQFNNCVNIQLRNLMSLLGM